MLSGLIISVLFMMVGLLVGGRHLIKKRLAEANARRIERSMGERCPCGYPLTDLDMGRCPECGNVVAFNATAEELGLTKEQLARIAEKRRERKEHKD